MPVVAEVQLEPFHHWPEGQEVLGDVCVVDVTQAVPFQYWPELQEVCVCVVPPEQPDIYSVAQLFTVLEPVTMYLVISELNQPPPIV